jgi:hypothetical protein
MRERRIDAVAGRLMKGLCQMSRRTKAMHLARMTSAQIEKLTEACSAFAASSVFVAILFHAAVMNGSPHSRLTRL